MGVPSQAKALVAEYRSILRIDPRWEIEIRCDGSNPDEWGNIDFNSEVWYATITISDDRCEYELERTVVHELLELASYETYELVETLLPDEDNVFSTAFDLAYRAARNRHIETMVPLVIAAKEHLRAANDRKHPAAGPSGSPEHRGGVRPHVELPEAPLRGGRPEP